MEEETKNETIGDIGLIGVLIGMVFAITGLIYGLIFNLTDSEIIDKMVIGLVIFLGGMTLFLFYQVKGGVFRSF